VGALALIRVGALNQDFTVNRDKNGTADLIRIMLGIGIKGC
jgi:hypothetical protein